MSWKVVICCLRIRHGTSVRGGLAGGFPTSIKGDGPWFGVLNCAK